MRKGHHFFEKQDGNTPDPFNTILSEAGPHVGAEQCQFLAHDFAAMPVMAPIFVGPLPVAGIVAPAASATHVSLAAPERPVILAAAGPVTSLSQTQVDALKAGLDQTLASIQSNVVAQVFGDTLPLLGDNLLSAATGGAAQLQFVTALKSAILSGMGTLTGSSNYTKAQIEGAINGALTAAGITGAGANLNLADGADVKLTFTTAKNYTALTTPVEADLGLPGLGVSTSGNAQTTFNHTFNFTTGLDATGFYLGTGAGQTTFTIGTNTTLPGFSADATLSLLKFTATNNAATPTSFTGNFNVTLKDPGGDGRLRSGELAGDLLDATLSGNAAVNLKLASNLGTAVLPDIAADLGYAWNFSNSVVNPAAGNAGFGNTPTVTFKNVSLGLGSFFDNFVGPTFEAVQIFTDPLQPIVDVLLTEIGFLSDLAGKKVTLLDVAGGIGAISPETASRLNLYAQLINFINAVPTNGAGARIDLGDFSLGAQDPRAAIFQLANAVPAVIRNALAPSAQNGDVDGFLDGKDALPGGGMSFPIIENPMTAINLLFGKPVDFFTYHVPGLDLEGLGFDEFFRIFGPFGVRLTATIEAHAFLDIGYDSTGILQFAASGDVEDIFNGFYVVDQPGPEARLTAQLKAFAAVNVIIAELGVGGGIEANLNAFLQDTDATPGDGRIHIGQMSNSCVFELSGEIVAGLSAYLEIGFGPFTETFEKDFGSVVLLTFNVASCDAAGMPGVPVLAHNTGSNVSLHVGMDASLRQIGSLEDSADDFVVGHVSGALGSEVVGVVGNGLLTEGGDPVTAQSYTVGNNGKINADGGEKDDTLALAPDVLSPSNMHGAEGNDRLIGGAGVDQLYGDAGFDLLVGGAGNDALDGGADSDLLDGQDDDDVLLGGSGSDILLGGAGADQLNGGPGYDTATYISSPIGVIINLTLGTGSGDAQGDTYVSIERFVGSPFADIMNGSTGPDNFSGDAGDDVLDGKEGDDLLVGDAGADSLTGGPGNDFAAYTLSLAGVNVSLATGTGTGGDAQGDTLNTIENLQGSADYADTLEGDAGPNWLRGLSGNNVLRGLGGNDLLEGGKDNDTLEGGDGNDTLRASGDVASLDPAVSGGIDMLYGGAGNDFLYGDAGGDTLDGGGDDDQIFGGKDNDMILGGAGNDTITGGAGADTVDTGEGTNSVSGDDGNDVITGGSGPDTLNGGAGSDTLNAGAGNNVLNGGAGIDVITSLSGDDIIYGGSESDQINSGDGNDIVEGGSGADAMDGGAGRDAIRYVSSPAAVVVDLQLNAPTGPVGSDAVGDFIANFEDLYGSAFADDLRGTSGDNHIEGGDGDDWVQGRAGADYVAGGNGNDLLEVGTLRGPVQDSQRNDQIFGGVGFDTITADFSNQTIPITVITGQTWTYVFADGASASDFENVHDFFTGSGNDVLRLDGASDDGFANLIRTGAGADTIYSGLGDDNVDAGDGVNVLHGDAGNDVLISGTDADTIDGGAGNDTISAGGGDNLITGGDGTDTITSGAGLDTITSGAGDDAISAGDGDNVINSGADNDYITTGSGHDTIIAEDGNDTIVAGAGRELIDAGAGNDLITVGALRGPVQDTERLDRIDGGAGFDIITADYSNQTLAISVIAGQTQSFDFADGAYVRNFENVHDFFTGSGNDSLRLDGASDDHFANLLKTGAGNDTIYSGTASDNVDAGDGDDFVNGGANDTVLVFSGFDVVGFTGPGETLIGGAGNDTISFVDVPKPIAGGGPGSPVASHFGVLVNLSTNVTQGSALGVTINGFENIIGTDYGDDLTGDDGPNIFMPLHGGGNVVSIGFGGPDRLDGKGGIDTLIIDFSREDLPTSSGIGTTSPATSAGTTVYSRLTPASPFSSQDQIFATGIERFQITGASKNDQISGGFRGSEDILIGLGGNDTLAGVGGSDVLIGGDGNDVLTGENVAAINSFASAGGHDVFDAGPGDDLVEDIAFNGVVSAPLPLNVDALFQLDGGTGFDTLSADFSNQIVAIVWDGAAPTDMTFADGAYARNFEQLRYFVSGSGNDSLTQLGRFDQAFHTNGGDDIIAPGLGNDTVYGGTGNDLLVLDYSVGDLPTYTAITGGGPDRNFRRDNPGVGGVDFISYREIERLLLTGTPRNDNLQDCSGDDIIYGGAGDDVIVSTLGGNNYFDGGDGNDTLTGFADNTNVDDTFIGGAGNDTLRGLSGNDTLLGGPGNDVLSGAEVTFGAAFGGHDLIDGGEGDDFVDESYAVSDTTVWMPAGSVLKLDGGPGFDILSADFANETQGVVFIAGQVNVNEFPDGAYIRNFEQIIDLVTGGGNDVLTQPGRINNQFSTRGGNDIINPGLGIDIVWAGAGGDDLLILDYSLGDDANLGGFTFNNGVGTRRDAGTNAIVDSINNGNGGGFERYQITGGSKADTIAGGSGADVLVGNGGNDTLNGGSGNDVIDAGPGDDRVLVEATSDTAMLDELDGGAGFDTLASARFVNQTAPVLFDSRAPTSTNFADGAYFRNFEQLEQLQTGSGADVLTQLGRVNNTFNTNGGDDVIAPGLGNDTVFAGAGNDLLILDYSETDGANVRMETSGLNFYRRDVSTNAIVDQIFAAEFERYQITGTRNNDAITTNAGDDIINPGRGNDTVNGAGGSDLLVLDWSAMTSGAQGANYTAFNATTGTGTLTTSDAAGFTVAFSNFERFDITGTGLADELRGLGLADVLRGGAGDDTLIGGASINGQWASSVISFTSQFSGQFAATNMLGVPDTFSYASAGTAWAPASQNGTFEQVVLGFATPGVATGVMIRENWGNGFVTRVDLLDVNDQYHTVFTGTDPSQPGAVVDFTVSFTPTTYLVKGVKLFVDTNHNLSTYEEIDAVQLQGVAVVADQLIGGPGSDLYIVDVLGNVIIEAPGEGVDEVRSQVDFVLPTNVENLVLLGSATTGTGNALANVITGNALANILDGGGGADTMSGGAGDDIYTVDSIADIISEQFGEGNDTVRALVDFTLSPNIENLILAGRALSGTGNALANIITGNARNNDLHGGDGNDVLTGGAGIGLAGSQEVDLLEGGAGADTFVLGDVDFRYYDDRSSLTPGTNAYARIVDFTPSQGDKLKLKGAATEYFLAASPVAGLSGTALFHDTNFDGLLDPTHDELLAILESPDVLTPANTVHAALFV